MKQFSVWIVLWAKYFKIYCSNGVKQLTVFSYFLMFWQKNKIKRAHEYLVNIDIYPYVEGVVKKSLLISINFSRINLKTSDIIFYHIIISHHPWQQWLVSLTTFENKTRCAKYLPLSLYFHLHALLTIMICSTTIVFSKIHNQ